MKRLAIIPARAGSKRIPRKNIKDFGGRPMIGHMIGAAQKAGIFNEIHVSTDSEEVAAIAGHYNAAPQFLRSAELADDHTPVISVVQHVLQAYTQQGIDFDTVAVLYATSPLADPEDLKKACHMFEEGERDKALLSVTRFPAPIEKAFRMERNGGAMVPDNAAAFAKRSQDLAPAYHDAGMFCFYTPDFVQARRGAGDFNLFRGYDVPSWRVTDIDEPDDWDRAEMLFKAVKGL